ncbi:SRPBCC domain-containing protein [Reichenbachiella sp. MSK19-1]|uniref:SRPBCC domain-containing protein n=1 Tax=Reichenbachiella sp. MSK19-1 TaxID=1897631 RepID=UPI000E6BE2A4|nr:SRPBCC domain-containing protein [Reichenbachiella sp. MSK19-1]RJE71560.1 hypothetical protein BGP76_05560 [Reichenbachiella sp. MSK19-1]
MKLEIKSQIDIHASADKIWEVLMDFDSYPEWNPLVREISGKAEEGQRIKVVLSEMTFKPDVLAVSEKREFRWRGKLGVRGLFDGEHYFVLEPTDKNNTRLIHGESFSGLLVAVLKKKLETGTLDGFKAMNESLKKRVEG